MIQDRMPERVVQVEFSEVQRIPTGLTRAVKAGEVCRLFLEKGCVVVRELVEEGGRKVVKSIGVPVNSGMVRTIYFEDEVLCVASTARQLDTLKEELAAGWRQSGVQQPPAVHPGGLAPEGEPNGLNGRPETMLKEPLPIILESTRTPPTAAGEMPPVPSVLPPESVLNRPRPSQPTNAEEVQPPSQEQTHGGHVPANAEEAILNRRPRRR